MPVVSQRSSQVTRRRYNLRSLARKWTAALMLACSTTSAARSETPPDTPPAKSSCSSSSSKQAAAEPSAPQAAPAMTPPTTLPTPPTSPAPLPSPTPPEAIFLLCEPQCQMSRDKLRRSFEALEEAEVEFDDNGSPRSIVTVTHDSQENMKCCDEYCTCEDCLRFREEETADRWETDERTLPQPGKVIRSPHWQYAVERILGRGSYGQVLECRRLPDGFPVAVKVLTTREEFASSCYKEAVLLEWLWTQYGGATNIVQLYDLLHHNTRLCLVMELLAISLYEYMARRSFRPLCLQEVANILRQLMLALQVLEDCGIVHADIKPDNIMLVREDSWPLQVKLIDFSCSFRNDEELDYFYVQTRYYRAPEVILRVSMDTPADMWSLGCVAAEVLMGRPLFTGRSDVEVLYSMCHMLGVPPTALLHDSPRTWALFDAVKRRNSWVWQLKGAAELGVAEAARERLSYLSEVADEHRRLLARHNQPDAPDREVLAFVSLFRRMMAMDPGRRIRPRHALLHPFIL